MPHVADFVIRRSDGKRFIVEIKKDCLRSAIRADLARAKSGDVPVTPTGRKAVPLPAAALYYPGILG